MTARWNSECVKCMANKFLGDFPERASEAERMEYMRRLFAILSSAKPEEGAPVITDYISKLQEEMFGFSSDFAEIKHTFNELMLAQETHIASDIKASDNPMERAIQYVMAGNYIDFGALDNVDNDKLFELLSKADSQIIDEKIFSELCNDLENAERLAYITDNCGEVVLDKLFIQTIQSTFPDIHVDIIVRESPHSMTPP